MRIEERTARWFLHERRCSDDNRSRGMLINGPETTWVLSSSPEMLKEVFRPTAGSRRPNSAERKSVSTKYRTGILSTRFYITAPGTWKSDAPPKFGMKLALRHLESAGRALSVAPSAIKYPTSTGVMNRRVTVQRIRNLRTVRIEKWRALVRKVRFLPICGHYTVQGNRQSTSGPTNCNYLSEISLWLL